MFTNIRVLRLRSTDWKSSLSTEFGWFRDRVLLDRQKSSFLSKLGSEYEASFLKQGNDWDETWAPHSRRLVSRSENMELKIN